MADLYLGLAIIAVASVVMWMLGSLISKRMSYLWTLAAIILILAGIALLRSDGDRLWFARWLPFSNLIVIGNITLPAVALAGGLLFRKLPGHRARRCILLAPLILLATYDLIRPLFGSLPDLRNAWQDGVCRQTSNDSCSPAAAATLLHFYGIEATEREMAALCLTHTGGTSAAGIYRGLKLKTAGHPFRIEAFHGDIATLRAMQTPMLLTVELKRGQHADSRYEKEWGWTPGVAHTVVLFRFLPNDRIEIGDPDIGRENWNLESLRVLWHGNAIRLAPE